ncbi:MAG: hypothetical protein KKD39_03125 [Candidatus Altiarchaeota archaeon]|nr:hypothetical protein [Candidatus Altiarchaeota archaeon]
MFGRKGQGAMEYLMTYGWAILVVMIVGIVMWQLGIFNMGSTTLTATGFAKIKPQLAGSGLSSSNAFVGVFTNGVGTKITVSTGTGTLIGGTTCGLVATPTTPSAGDNFQLAGTCTSGGNAGDVYTLTISMPYTVTIGTVTTSHTESGVLRGPLE